MRDEPNIGLRCASARSSVTIKGVGSDSCVQFCATFFRSLVNLTNERREKSSQGLRRRTCRGTIHAFQIGVCATTFTILIFSIFVDGLKTDDGCLGSNNDERGNEVRQALRVA